MRRRLVALVAVLALAGTGCGGGSDEDSVGQRGDGPTTTARRQGEADGPGSILGLSAKSIAFDKQALTAAGGSVSIRFDNQDNGVPHNLHVTGSGVDEKTEIAAGPATQTLKLNLRPGTYTYVCDVHPQQMKGELIVA